MPRRPIFRSDRLLSKSEIVAASDKDILDRRSAALRALEKAEMADDREAIALARQRVRQAQLLIERNDLDQ